MKKTITVSLPGLLISFASERAKVIALPGDAGNVSQYIGRLIAEDMEKVKPTKRKK